MALKKHMRASNLGQEPHHLKRHSNTNVWFLQTPEHILEPGPGMHAARQCRAKYLIELPGGC